MVKIYQLNDNVFFVATRGKTIREIESRNRDYSREAENFIPESYPDLFDREYYRELSRKLSFDAEFRINAAVCDALCGN